MMTELIAEANVEKGTFEHRPLTEAEIEQELIDQENLKKIQVLQKENETEKATAKAALLAKLNITEDEARLLLG